METIAVLRARTKQPFIVADENGRVLEVNEAFERVFGWARADILGQPLSSIIPPNLRDAHHLGFSRFLTTERPTLLNQSLNLKAVARDGRIFDATHFIVAEKADGQWRFAAAITPL